MNLILVTYNEFKKGILLNDFRTEHIIKILKLKDNDKFKFGIIGKKDIYHCIYKKDKKLFFKKILKIGKSNKPIKLKILIGLIRPIVAKRIIKELASIGVSEIIFFDTELSEKSYSNSNLFTKKIYRQYLIIGAMQGGTTYLPKVKIIKNLKESLKNVKLRNPKTTKILLEKSSNKNLIKIKKINLATIIVGPERGFTNQEIKLIKNFGFIPYNISSNILRTETAILTASIIAASKIKIK